MNNHHTIISMALVGLLIITAESLALQLPVTALAVAHLIYCNLK